MKSFTGKELEERQWVIEGHIEGIDGERRGVSFDTQRERFAR